MTELKEKATEWIRSQGWSEENLPNDEYIQMCDAYIAGAKELENEYILKLKDTSLVRALKDSIIMNEKLSSQEQQELCAWIEAAMEFGENLDECAKENAELKKQQFSLKNERNTFLAQNEQYEKDLIDFNENLTEAKEIMQKLIANAPDTYSGTNIELQQKKMFSFQDAVNKAEQFLNNEVKE